MTTLGDCELMFSFWFSLPMRAVSSSLTILMTICAGERLSSTSAPVARSVTLRTKSLTTLKFTSASSSASLTSRMASFTSASVSRLAAQAFERLGQLVRQGFKCHGIYPFRS